ncbi:MAG: D-aminoacyl-tRNA deacylase [Acidimicrobiia bacterium]|nr:D-aminoacyl-tRNA deacylase [Acidimicrobiia bacterium]
MRIVAQRVSRASVRVGHEVVGEIGAGLLLLVGVAAGDGPPDSAAAVAKISDLRVFADDEGRMNRSVVDTRGQILVVSQFTLLGDLRRGRRPSFTAAAEPDHAKELLDDLVSRFRAAGIETAEGRFGARMEVDLVNDGPVTIILEVSGGRVV